MEEIIFPTCVTISHKNAETFYKVYSGNQASQSTQSSEGRILEYKLSAVVVPTFFSSFFVSFKQIL